MHAPLKRSWVWALIALFLLLWFGNLDYRHLIRPDEGRYAELGREMAVTGDWITPRLNGIKYFEKPPLQYWATAAAYRVFGESEWTARLWPALTGFAGLLLTALIGAQLFGRRAGLCAALVLAASSGYMLIAHMATLDMGLTFFMTLALGGLVLGTLRPADSKTRRWTLAGWAGMAGAVLSKGLIGLVLPVAVMGLYILIRREWQLLRRLELVRGGLLFLLITAPWFIAVSLENPRFAEFFFVHEHFQRFLTPVHRRTEPWWYFIPMLIAGMLPWTTLLPDALTRACRERDTARSARWLLMLWAAFIFLFFSASNSKLPSYILPIFPAVALLIGERLAARSLRLRWHAMFIALVGVALVIGAQYATRYNRVPEEAPLYASFVPWIVAAGITLAATGLISLRASRNSALAAAIVICFGSIGALQLLAMGHDELAPVRSYHDTAVKLRPYLRPDTPIYSVAIYEQTAPFYLKRTVTLVGFADEMAFGLEEEPHLALARIEDFAAQWQTRAEAAAMMTPAAHAELTARGLPMHEIARDRRLVTVTRHARAVQP